MTTVALTYDEIAQRAGITIASARRLVHRRRWSKSKGNDGRALVQIPVEFLENRPNDKPSDGRGGNPNGSQHATHQNRPDNPNGISELLARLTAAQVELVEMARRLGIAEGERAALRGDLATERERAERLASPLQG